MSGTPLDDCKSQFCHAAAEKNVVVQEITSYTNFEYRNNFARFFGTELFNKIVFLG